MFIPHTKGGTLKRMLTEMEEKLPFLRKWKYIERSGKAWRTCSSPRIHGQGTAEGRDASLAPLGRQGDA